MKFDVINKFSGIVQFTADIDCDEDASNPIKIGLAVKWAYKVGANLDGANFDGANLGRANLARANFDGANFGGAYYGKNVPMTKRPIQIAGLFYSVMILDTHIKIGCELHAIDDWFSFDDNRISKMDGEDALTFWRENKHAIKAMAEMREV